VNEKKDFLSTHLARWMRKFICSFCISCLWTAYYWWFPCCCWKERFLFVSNSKKI